MGVTGLVTASQGASYVPPFKYVTSYAPAPIVTGTITGEPFSYKSSFVWRQS